jgi:hypothetical protein
MIQKLNKGPFFAAIQQRDMLLAQDEHTKLKLGTFSKKYLQKVLINPP